MSFLFAYETRKGETTFHVISINRSFRDNQRVPKTLLENIKDVIA